MTKKFPNQIPIFPLSGVIYFPNTNLPLNIFEQRYLDLVNDCFRKDKLMGMIQSKSKDKEVYRVGCLGKISDFHIFILDLPGTPGTKRNDSKSLKNYD